MFRSAPLFVDPHGRLHRYMVLSYDAYNDLVVNHHEHFAAEHRIYYLAGRNVQGQCEWDLISEGPFEPIKTISVWVWDFSNVGSRFKKIPCAASECEISKWKCSQSNQAVCSFLVSQCRLVATLHECPFHWIVNNSTQVFKLDPSFLKMASVYPYLVQSVMCRIVEI